MSGLALGRDAVKVGKGNKDVGLGLSDVVFTIGGQESLLLLDTQQHDNGGNLVKSDSAPLVEGHEVLLEFNRDIGEESTVGVGSEEELDEVEEDGEESHPGVEGDHVCVGVTVVLGNDRKHGERSEDDHDEPTDSVKSLAEVTAHARIMLEGESRDGHEAESNDHQKRMPVENVLDSSVLSKPNTLRHKSGNGPNVSPDASPCLQLGNTKSLGVFFSLRTQRGSLSWLAHIGRFW
mmetsp:Transcript_10129/g.16959  ORF Transcript_10129/g.16959 Transcript_10129/m.16959 type:complete len:235 (-) Transcript_10129:92-796(-)